MLIKATKPSSALDPLKLTEQLQASPNVKTAPPTICEAPPLRPLKPEDLTRLQAQLKLPATTDALRSQTHAFAGHLLQLIVGAHSYRDAVAALTDGLDAVWELQHDETGIGRYSHTVDEARAVTNGINDKLTALWREFAATDPPQELLVATSPKGQGLRVELGDAPLTYRIRPPAPAHIFAALPTLDALNNLGDV
jgi:hypothetical protein